jgi:hypothetical protein|tara:strand:- start:249 stop:353 length:105 start_codon:yes stop_codon:yes gene_type:complete
VKDVEIATQLDMLKMAYWKFQGKMKDYVNSINGK